MQIIELKNKLTEWLDKLVYFKEELINIKSIVYHRIHSPEIELNVDEVKNHVDEIFTIENIISIMLQDFMHLIIYVRHILFTKDFFY